jgi:hypothetical protein
MADALRTTSLDEAMTNPLFPCPACSRHVRASETLCPFCNAGLDLADAPAPVVPAERLGRSALMGFQTLLRAGLVAATAGTIASCTDGGAVPIYGAGAVPNDFTGGRSAGAPSGGAGAGGTSGGGTSAGGGGGSAGTISRAGSSGDGGSAGRGGAAGTGGDGGTGNDGGRSGGPANAGDGGQSGESGAGGEGGG